MWKILFSTTKIPSLTSMNGVQNVVVVHAAGNLKT